MCRALRDYTPTQRRACRSAYVWILFFAPHPPCPLLPHGQGRTERLSKDAFSGVTMGNPSLPPTPLPHCGRGTNLEQVYCVVMLSETCIAHIFCLLLNSHTGRRGSRGIWRPETGERTRELSKKSIAVRGSQGVPPGSICNRADG